MNLILGNFDDLVKFIHPVEVRGARSQANDTVLQQLGLGIAMALQRSCRRTFARIADELFVTTTEGTVVLPRYPIEGIAKIEARARYSDGWTEELDAIEDLDHEAGIVTLSLTGRVRITYTGGYWTETLEPTDNGYPSTMPSSATPLPADLKTAWLLATQNAWEHKDHWVPKVLGGNAETSPLNLADLADNIPPVAQAITDYRRMLL